MGFETAKQRSVFSYLLSNMPSSMILLHLIAAVWAPPLFADVPQAERDALVALYTSTGGANWLNHDHWNTADPVCTATTINWYGISCDAASAHVTRIGLGSNRLTGRLTDLSALSMLQVVNIETNRLTGSIPPLSGLTNLTDFSANTNQLTGSIPALSGLAKLNSFAVAGNELTGSLPSLIGLTRLSNLVVSFNTLSGTLDANALPSSLVTVDIANNAFSGVIPAAPSGLMAGRNSVCPNLFTPAATPETANDQAWDKAVGGTSPWSALCAGAQSPLTSLSFAPNPAVVGQSVTASIAVTLPLGAVPPCGNVVVVDSVDSSATCSLPIGGSGTCTLSFASAGAHTLTARYSGCFASAGPGLLETFATSSATANESVTPTPLIATAASLSLAPTLAVVGQGVAASVTVRASSGDGTPSGMVAISDSIDASAKCTASLAGGAGTCALTFATVGAHTLTAEYSGDASFAPSAANFLQYINPSPLSVSTTTLSAAPSPAIVGEPVVFSVTVDPPSTPAPSGTVTVASGAVTSGLRICTANLVAVNATTSAGSCSITFADAGTYSVMASYLGDVNNAPSSATMALTVNAVAPPPSAVSAPLLNEWTLLGLLCGVVAIGWLTLRCMTATGDLSGVSVRARHARRCVVRE